MLGLCPHLVSEQVLHAPVGSCSEGRDRQHMSTAALLWWGAPALGQALWFLAMAAGSWWGWANPSLGPSSLLRGPCNPVHPACTCLQDTAHWSQTTPFSPPGTSLLFLYNQKHMTAHEFISRSNILGNHINPQR